MDLKGIISVSGMSGLFKVVAQTKNGFIVESLADKKRFPVTSSQRISSLEDISIYTVDEDVPLQKVLQKMKEVNGDTLPVSSKSDNKELAAYFKTILPNFDEERVYASDIKKVVNWYGLLKDIISLDSKEEKKSKKAKEEPETEAAPVVAKKPKKEKAPAATPPVRVKAEAKKGGTAKTRKKV